VLEVSGLDRPGLLYDLTTAIEAQPQHRLGPYRDLRREAVDVFYVTDLTHAKIVSTGRQLTIRKALIDVFKFEAEKPAGQGESAGRA
jgi:[protein-PII] uridylyltransferase